jgi:hypothetical protein
MIGNYHIRRFVTWEVGGYQFGSQWDRRCYVGLAREEKVFDEQDLWGWGHSAGCSAVEVTAIGGLLEGDLRAFECYFCHQHVAPLSVPCENNWPILACLLILPPPPPSHQL